jgi:signal transduction histidine kinase
MKVIRIEVEDSGLGIREEDQGKLFKMFGKLEQNNGEINP